MSCTEWKEYKLDEVYEVSNGLSKKREEFGFGYEFLAFTDVFNNYFVPQTLDNLVNSSEMERVKCSIKRGDVFLTRTSEKLDELGRSCVALKDYPNATFNGFTKRLRPIGNVEILPEYAGYYFRSLKFRNAVTSMSSMTTRASLNNDMISLLTITVPTLEEQENIANILSCLDEKIELNNEMNKTLEEMAQCIFKRWFVDFEFPNENGEPYKSSGGEMVDSELGMIPKGWEVKKISELIEVKDGTHASPKVSKEGFPLVTSKHIKGDRIAIEDAKIISEKDYLEVNKRSKVDTGDILISMIGTVGLTYFVQEEEINFAIKNIGLFKTSQNKTLSEYFYLYLKSDNMKNYIEARLAGTTQKYISLGELRNIPVVLPNDSIIDKFKKVVGVLLDKRRLNIINNEELMITRDTLLPKLMNGEIMI